MKTQQFEWGHIDWMYEPDNSHNIIHIGIVVIDAHARHKKHIHYGDEQFLYIISGIGMQSIGERMSAIEPGSLYHVEAGSAHETINTGDEPLYELLISIPAFYNMGNLFVQNKIQNMIDTKREMEFSIKLDGRIKKIYDETIGLLKLPLSIIDQYGNCVMQGKDFPAFCEKNCHVSADLGNCPLYAIQDSYLPPYYMEPSAFVCHYGISNFFMPIICNNEVVGVIKGGHIRTSSGDTNVESHVDAGAQSDADREMMQLTSNATVTAILEQIKKLSKNIVNYYILENTEIGLDKREELIRDITRNEIVLEETLRSTQERVLNIQINNHFLFNTLNAIAGLAIKENADKTYASILNLAKMFRYTLKTSSNFVDLQVEMDYLRNFIDLQKIRYGEKLQVLFAIAPAIGDISIPFNCLQPIVENCFVHAFKNKTKDLGIRIEVKPCGAGVSIEISDNGEGLSVEKLQAVRAKIEEEQRRADISGLMMVYGKLQMFYRQNFTFAINSVQGEGTSIKLIVPYTP